MTGKSALTGFIIAVLMVSLVACSQSENEPAESATAAVESPTSAANADDCTITPPSEPVACTMEYDPVCGCDGKTYPNACAAGAAGVPSSTPGACPEAQSNPNN